MTSHRTSWVLPCRPTWHICSTVHRFARFIRDYVVDACMVLTRIMTWGDADASNAPAFTPKRYNTSPAPPLTCPLLATPPPTSRRGDVFSACCGCTVFSAWCGCRCGRRRWPAPCPRAAAWPPAASPPPRPIVTHLYRDNGVIQNNGKSVTRGGGRGEWGLKEGWVTVSYLGRAVGKQGQIGA